VQAAQAQLSVPVQLLLLAETQRQYCFLLRQAQQQAWLSAAWHKVQTSATTQTAAAVTTEHAADFKNMESRSPLSSGLFIALISSPETAKA
jgi:hypothetical protein